MHALDNAPGPSPWYFGPHSPKVAGFEWDRAGDGPDTAGHVLLKGKDGPVLVLGFYNYAMALGDDLLVWHQPRHSQPGAPALTLRLFCCRALEPMSEPIPAICAAMKDSLTGFTSRTPPFVTLEIGTDLVGVERPLEFPKELQTLDELLMLCLSAAITDEMHVALVVAKPSRGTYQLYPQEWFNRGGFDYGYEWITRVARDPGTGRIHGDGIRIASFVLDDSLRGLRRG